MLDLIEKMLKRRGIDFNKQIIEISCDACNQVIMMQGHVFQGYSIRKLLEIWQRETGQKFKET